MIYVCKAVCVCVCANLLNNRYVVRLRFEIRCEVQGSVGRECTMNKSYDCLSGMIHTMVNAYM